MSTMGRSHRSHHSQYYVSSDRDRDRDRGYYSDRPYSDRPMYTTSDRQLYSVSDRPPGMYSSERQLYFGNGVPAPLPPPTEHSQIVVDHKKPKIGPCSWILMCVFVIFVIVVIICLVIFFTWGKTIQSKSEYDATHQNG